MAIFIDHVNVVLGKLRAEPITSLSTDTTTIAYRTQIAVRRAVWRVWNAKQWSFKLRTHTLAVSSAASVYRLPKTVGEPVSIKSSVDPYKLTVINEAAFDKGVPNPTATGNPEFVRLFEMTGVTNQPSSASTLSISSSSSADTSQLVLIKGLVNGEVDYEQVTLSGTSTVTTSKSFSSVIAISKSAETSGVVTVLAGAVTVGALAPQEKVLRRRAVRFYPDPSSSITITFKHFGLPPELTHAYEDTEIPTRWDYVVEQYGLALALQSQGQEQLQEFTSNMQLADSMLQNDMASEEYISAEEIILPERFGGTGEVSWINQLSGFGYTY